MVLNVHANSAKRCKKKVHNVADFRDKIGFLKLRKSLNKDSKIIGEKGADSTHSRKVSTSDLRQYNNETKVRSTIINECKFDREIINDRSSSNFKNSKPSLRGSTMRIGNLDRKSTGRIYRRKINYYKALIKILMNTRAKDLSDTIVNETLRFSRNDDDVKFSGNISAMKFSNDKITDTDSESADKKKRGILSGKRRGADGQTPLGPKCSAGRKSIELTKTSGKIFEKYFTAASTSAENVSNGSFENFDDKSTDCEMSYRRNRNNSDSEATIPNKTELFNKHQNSLDTIADEKAGENIAAETWLQKCIDPFEFDDSDVANQSLRESVKDTKILETAKKTGRLKSAMKKDQKIQSVALEEDGSSSVKRNVNVSSVNDAGSKKPCISKKTEQRNNSRKNEVEDSAVYIPDVAIKGGKTFKDTLKPGTKSKKDEEGEKVSKKSEARNSNQPECIVKSKAKGNHSCSCKRTKYKDVKTSAYSVPANIEYPSLNIRKECGKRSAAGIRSFDNLISEKDKVVSLIGEKKTERFYSPLELEYSDVLKSKLDADHNISNNQSSRPINNDSSKAQKRSLNSKEKKLKKFSISNFTVSGNSSSKNDETNTECSKNHSKSLKIPTFSNYSIPVSIEINMSKDDSAKLLLSMNSVQSKLTRYFPLLKLQNKNKQVVLPDKSLNFNSTIDLLSESKNTAVGRSKSKSRSLPIIESDVLLKDTEKVTYFKNIPPRKPQLSISRNNYLYGVLNESKTPTAAAAAAASNQNNIIYRENLKSASVMNGKEKSRNSHDLIYIDDSNSSIESIVPPSYSIFSDNDDYNDDNNKSTIIDINKILDTQQREDLLAPWESATNLVYL